ncbi:MAG: hypothetical protein HY255_08580 [Betaproteobacteria bacterium]|nr:hypothetical protein [Betaproteobacteria bacterium]
MNTGKAQMWRRFSQIGLLWLIAAIPTQAQLPSNDTSEKSINNLMVVLRESQGLNKLDEKLVSSGKVKAKLPDGKEVEIDQSWFEYIGDMHIRFVFDGPQTMMGATPMDLERLKLGTAEQALKVAVANIKRVYGEPSVSAWNDLMLVSGKSSDLDSSYFLDRLFWQNLLMKHPEGLVVSVPRRGGLLYTPLSNAKAVDGLRKSVGYLHSSSGRLRISSALYLFKDDAWTVFQPASK